MIAIFPTHPDGLYLAVLYYTGMRPGEVRGLQWGDIDWDANLIHVQRDVDYADGGRARERQARQVEARRADGDGDHVERQLADGLKQLRAVAAVKAHHVGREVPAAAVPARRS